MPLTGLQAAFCKEYIKTRNGLQSYKKLRPNMDDNSCSQSAYRLLSDVDVKAYIKELDVGSDITIISSRQSCIKRLDRYADKAEDAEQYAVAGANVERIGKFMGHFNAPEADMAQYNTLIQSVIVNIDKDKQDTIDVEAVE